MDYPLINGTRYSFSSIELKIGNQRFVGFKETNYSQELTPGEVRGASSQLLGRTRGDLKPDGSLSLFEEEWNELNTQLGDGYMEKVFDVTVTYADDGVPTVTDVIKGARIKKVDKSRSQSSEGIVVKLDLSVMYIIFNGKNPLKKMLAATAPSSSTSTQSNAGSGA